MTTHDPELSSVPVRASACCLSILRSSHKVTAFALLVFLMALHPIRSVGFPSTPYLARARAIRMISTIAEVVRTVGRHARARIPNDVRVREADYFDGSRAPESQGQKGSELATTENPKGEQTNLIAKRARASNLNHFGSKGSKRKRDR